MLDVSIWNLSISNIQEVDCVHDMAKYRWITADHLVRFQQKSAKEQIHYLSQCTEVLRPQLMNFTAMPVRKLPRLHVHSQAQLKAFMENLIFDDLPCAWNELFPRGLEKASEVLFSFMSSGYRNRQFVEMITEEKEKLKEIQTQLRNSDAEIRKTEDALKSTLEELHLSSQLTSTFDDSIHLDHRPIIPKYISDLEYLQQYRYFSQVTTNWFEHHFKYLAATNKLQGVSVSIHPDKVKGFLDDISHFSQQNSKYILPAMSTTFLQCSWVHEDSKNAKISLVSQGCPEENKMKD